ncbi:MAG: hypothetical protein KDA36_11785, partial [Planctomycetaceae bacterium]|nr:hypothetical protein [Planctomycetaceae bacterium]
MFLVLGGLSESGSGSDYLQHVKPLLEQKCYACHGAFKQQGSLRVDTAESLLRGGDSGAAVTPKHPEESLLIGVLTGDAGFRMPPENDGAPLTAEEIELVRDWIKAGAPLPEKEEPQADPRTWWSYVPIERPPLPGVQEPGWCRNELDFFITAARESHELRHAPEAPKE